LDDGWFFFGNILVIHIKIFGICELLMISQKLTGAMVLIVRASGGRPFSGERRSPLQCKARKSNGMGNPPGCPISGGSRTAPTFRDNDSPR